MVGELDSVGWVSSAHLRIVDDRLLYDGVDLELLLRRRHD